MATDQTPLNISLQTQETATIQNNFSQSSQTIRQNMSLRDDCIPIVFSQMEFIPWKNPDNIVSAEVEDAVRLVKEMLLVFFFLIGGPANVMNMAVFYKQGLHDRVNLCLFVLSLVDEVFLTAQTIYHGEQILLHLTTKQMFGPVTAFLTNNNVIVLFSLCYISPILSTIIAIERCLCVFNPLKFQTLIRTRTIAAIIVVVSTVVMGLYFVVVYRFHTGCVYDPVTGITVLTAVAGEFYLAHKQLVDLLDSVIFGSALPVTLMVVVTVTTVMTIVKLRHVMKWRSEASSSFSSREVALTKMLVGNSIFFVACTAPIAITRLTWLSMPEVNSGRRHHNFYLTGIRIGQTFTFINATFNFVIYYVMGSRYRETFWALFGKKLQPAKE